MSNGEPKSYQLGTGKFTVEEGDTILNSYVNLNEYSVLHYAVNYKTLVKSVYRCNAQGELVNRYFVREFKEVKTLSREGNERLVKVIQVIMLILSSLFSLYILLDSHSYTLSIAGVLAIGVLLVTALPSIIYKSIIWIVDGYKSNL